MIDALVPPAKLTAPATSALSREIAEVGLAISAGQFRDALAYAATAITLLATGGAAGVAGVACSALCTVCDTPPTILSVCTAAARRAA